MFKDSTDTNASQTSPASPLANVSRPMPVPTQETSETTSPLKTVKRPTRIEAKSTFTLNNAQDTQSTVKNDD